MVLTRDASPSLFYLRARSCEGSLGGEEGVPLPLDDCLLLREGDGLRFEGLLQLLAPSHPRRERLHVLAQSDDLSLGLLGPLLSRRPLHVALAVGAGELDP